VNIQQMMKQAQQMQERLQKQMAELRVEASAGGGMVKVVMTGDLRIETLAIDPDAVDPEDVEMLQDLVVAAINEAIRSGQELQERKLGGAGGEGFDPMSALDALGGLGGLGGGGLGGAGGLPGGMPGGGNRAARRAQQRKR
jgi:DNA-binding YbaB/EbfC family protein